MVGGTPLDIGVAKTYFIIDARIDRRAAVLLGGA
jgi:hypothetical protein